jgi:hypothetical protein
MQGEQIDVLLDELLGHERARHVEVRTAPREARHVFDLDARDGPGHTIDERRAKNVGREQLPQRLHRVERARGPVGADVDAGPRHGEPVAFVAESRERGIEAQRDDLATRARRADHRQAVPGGRLQPIG